MREKPTNAKFINYVWYLLHVSALHCHLQGAFLVLSERRAVDRILWMGVLCLVAWCVAISDHLPDNTLHSQQTSLSLVEFEPIIPASERMQTHSLDPRCHWDRQYTNITWPIYIYLTTVPTQSSGIMSCVL
jgi:hypothetical protein